MSQRVMASTCLCVCVVLVGLGMHYSFFHLIQ